MNHVLAHQGGWDEMFLVIIPLVVLAMLLAMAGARAKRIAREDDDQATDTDRGQVADS